MHTKDFLDFREKTQIIDIKDSSLLMMVIYDYKTEELTVVFVPDKYFTDKITYEGVPSILFEEMALNRQNSYGKFYLEQIKSNFKQKKLKKMGSENQPKGKNEASDKKRFIRGSINLSEMKKEWLTQGEKGIYLNFTLQMLPDGEVDRFQNLGMLTQDVPKEIYEKEKTLPKSERTQGPILGNMKEPVWEGGGNAEGQNSSNLPTVNSEVLDDLPF